VSGRVSGIGGHRLKAGLFLRYQIRKDLKLEKQDFLQVIKNTPLVAIDLIVKDERGRVLLGLRKNKPAQGFWFVPGGRIYKDERIADALTRIGLEEIGTALSPDQVRYIGVFEHLYEDNVAGISGISTHYICLACEVIQPKTPGQLPVSQHDNWRFWEIKGLLDSNEVHQNTKGYFEEKSRTQALKE
jgi:colanic acid biosynthesis protein WcaH